MQQTSALHLLLPRLVLPHPSHGGMRPRDGRPLEARRVARHGRKPSLPDPPQHVLGRLDAEEVGACTRGDGLLRRVVFGVVPRREARADEQDVAGLEGDVLLGGDLLQVLEGDVAAREGVERECVLGAKACVVEQDAPADDATLLDPGFFVY